jgi:hypothetical protein
MRTSCALTTPIRICIAALLLPSTRDYGMEEKMRRTSGSKYAQNGRLPHVGVYANSGARTQRRFGARIVSQDQGMINFISDCDPTNATLWRSTMKCLAIRSALRPTLVNRPLIRIFPSLGRPRLFPIPLRSEEASKVSPTFKF